MTTQRSTGRGRRRITARQVVALVVAVLALVFVLQNRDPVGVHLFTLTLSAPLWLLLVVMIAVGLLLGVVLTRRR
ncbi:LapA family protein [Pseudonocardia kujensis]|uniref:LapA family protein n=1 Tax=Pseudonocardia kujensis TaxID=1128675 RepID=UPI001E3ABD35|nr:LapA family protein [Pseudonocardia kujensis]MCE0761517.1 LapA family protein [Pseudonocardia kujensis]